jgi:hypothetical protein
MGKRLSVVDDGAYGAWVFSDELGNAKCQRPNAKCLPEAPKKPFAKGAKIAQS